MYLFFILSLLAVVVSENRGKKEGCQVCVTCMYFLCFFWWVRLLFISFLHYFWGSNIVHLFLRVVKTVKTD